MDGDVIRAILSAFLRRSEAIKAAGGISLQEHLEGKPIPDGWVMDSQCSFFVPPDWEVMTSPL